MNQFSMRQIVDIPPICTQIQYTGNKEMREAKKKLGINHNLTERHTKWVYRAN